MSEFIKTLRIGIYGSEELSTKCVREQKDSADCVLLDEVVKDAVGTEFYRYLRVKHYTAAQVGKKMSTKKLNS